MIVIDCQQGTPEWAQARAGLATASCFDVILSKGATRANLCTDLALERLTGVPLAGSFENNATRQGKEREAEARRAFEVEHGTLVQTVGFIRHDTLAAGASPDGLIGDEGGLEIKAPMPKAHSQVIRTRKVPSVYVPQVQGNLWITRRRWWRFASYNPDFPPELRLVVIDVYRDQAYIDRLAAEVEVFLGEVEAEFHGLRAEQEAERRRRA